MILDLKLLEETHFGQTYQPTPAIVDHKQLPLLVDVAKQGFVCKVTSIRTMNDNPSYKGLLSEIYKLLRLYLIVPATSATSERTFSV